MTRIPVNRHSLMISAGLVVGLTLATCGDDDGDTPAPDAGPTCGNGILEPGEECDDGNQSNQDGCCNTCLSCPVCNQEAWSSCDATSLCCPTFEDRPTACVDSTVADEPSRCVPPCNNGLDCYWSNECDTRYPGHCWPAWCGPEEDGSPVNGACSVNGRFGHCYPVGAAQGDYGLCIEPGTVAAGDTCEAGHSLDEIPRQVETCANGVCTHWLGGRAPQCLAFCDPVAAYDATGLGADGCPDGFNCVNFSSLSGLSGLRLADKGRCIPTPSTDADGLLACDLLSDALIHHRALTCADVMPDSRCGLYRTGSLMGICRAAEPAPLPEGTACTSDATQLPCGAGHQCVRADPFGAGDATDMACREVCDAADAGWTCAAAGLTCTSLSHPTEDASPTRLGLCAPPPAE